MSVEGEGQSYRPERRLGDTVTTRVMMTSVLALVMSAGGGGAWAQATTRTPAAASATTRTSPAQADSAAQNQNAAPAEVEQVQVTGSRLRNGDVTANVQVITEEEIKARGVTSIEELMRTLPQNVANVSALTNERARGPLRNRTQPVSRLGSLGVSAANLGGMGAGNTLVLVNGRRVAGAAGIEDGFANLNGIPLSAVARVEITTGGASAVYGADATAGVINFILKRDFVGTTMTAQTEYSNNGAENSRISLFSGYSWRGGNLTGTLDYNRRDPILNRKTGYVSNDYSSYYGGNSFYDKRSFTQGLQPGVINTPEYVYDPILGYTVVRARGLTVRPGFTGRPAVSDFVTIGRESLPDFVPKYAGNETESASLTLNFEQNLTSRLSVFANGLYSRSKNTQEIEFSGIQMNMAPGQYYNPFPAFSFSSYQPGVNVYYDPRAEVEAGILPSGNISNTYKSWNINAGVRYKINDDTRIEANYTTSQSESGGDRMVFGSLAGFERDSSSPTGFSCYNFLIANNRYPANVMPDMKAAFDRQCLALSSADPSKAFNPWKTNADGGGSSIADFYYRDAREDRSSRLETYDIQMNGVLKTLPAGKVYYVIGAEYASDGVNSDEVKVRTGQAVDRDRYAYFGELSVPVFGPDFNRFLARSLTFTLAARNDTYKTFGAIGTDNRLPVEQGGKLIFGSNRFSRTTPSYGVRWEPFEGLALRAKWSEGFQAPPFTQLFDQQGTTSYQTTIYDDPLFSCIGCVSWMPTRNAYSAQAVRAPNPDLKPQTSKQQSYGLTWRPTGTLQGLSFDVVYNRTVIDNEFANLNVLGALMPAADVLKLEQFYPRDASGRITQQRTMIFNILGSEYESMTYDLSYLWQTQWGTFEPRLTVLDNLVSRRQAFANTPAVSSLGTITGADEYKVVGALGWYYHDLSANLWAYYTPSYVNNYIESTYAGIITNPQDNRKVDDFLTVDMTFAWQAAQNIRVNFAGRNILDAQPPFVVVERLPYDAARYNPAGRTLSVELQYSF